jgi:hypothetical protein
MDIVYTGCIVLYSREVILNRRFSAVEENDRRP